MTRKPAVPAPSPDEIRHGCDEYERREKRDAMYKVASFLVDRFWDQPAEMADALGVLLLTWNQAFYRYGSFDFDELEKCIASNLRVLGSYRHRAITTYAAADDAAITALFEQFLVALQITGGSVRGRRSPVGTAKALHLLAPNFFPIWDAEIARAYDCYYASQPAERYLQFLRKIRQIVSVSTIAAATATTGKTIVKLVDEYNYARFTKRWI